MNFEKVKVHANFTCIIENKRDYFQKIFDSRKNISKKVKNEIAKVRNHAKYYKSMTKHPNT